MPTARTAYGITYYSYTLHDWRRLRSPRDIPRDHWPILKRRADNHERRNRIDHRDGAIPQRGGVDHIGAGFEDRAGVDTGAEALCEYGLNPANKRASWNAGGDSDTICLLAPPDTRPWQHGIVNNAGVDMNSAAIGYEDGVYSSNWNLLPEPKRTAHYRMRAAFWALWMGFLGWPLVYTPDRARVLELARRGESWGLTQHADLDPANRMDAGYAYLNGRKVNTFNYNLLFRMIREEQAIRAGGSVITPGLPATPSEAVRTVQRLLNQIGIANLDEDGLIGTLTKTAIATYANSFGYTGHHDNYNTLTPHLEDTMSKLDDLITAVNALPGRTASAVTGTRFPGAGGARLDDVLVATWRRAGTIDPDVLAAALRQVPGGASVDPKALAASVADEMGRRLAGQEG